MKPDRIVIETAADRNGYAMKTSELIEMMTPSDSKVARAVMASAYENARRGVLGGFQNVVQEISQLHQDGTISESRALDLIDDAGLKFAEGLVTAAAKITDRCGKTAKARDWLENGYSEQ